MTIPVLSFRADDFVDDLRDVCHRVGFFQLVDHGVPRRSSTGHFAALAEFFALPVRRQGHASTSVDSPHFRGWERVGAELTDNRHRPPRAARRVDRAPAVPGRRRSPPYLRLDGPNQWLPERCAARVRAIVAEFLDRLGAVADELMDDMAVGLGLPVRPPAPSVSASDPIRSPS